MWAHYRSLMPQFRLSADGGYGFQEEFSVCVDFFFQIVAYKLLPKINLTQCF